MALARVDHQHVFGARCRKDGAAGPDGFRELRHVVSERLAEASRFQKIALHVDDDERGAIKVNRERSRLGRDGCLRHSLPVRGS